MRIAHHYWYMNGNWGDRAIALGIHNLCRRFFGDCSFEIFPISSKLFSNSKEIERLNSCDFLIVGGGGIIGWYPTFQKYLNKIKIPMIVYGVGLNLFRTKAGEEILGESHKKNLQSMIDKSIYFSVRNDGSKKILNELGFNVEKESPDPILWTALNRKLDRIIPSKYVIIQIAGDYLWERYVHNGILPIMFCKKIRNIAEFLVDRGYKIQFPVHQIINDPINLTNDEICYPYLKGLENHIIHWNWKTCIENMYLSLSYYAYSDIVIAMRSHSLMTGIANYRPSISLGTQDKNMFYMKNFGLERFNIGINNPNFEDKIEELVINIEMNWHRISDHIHTVCSNLFSVAKKDFEDIKRRLNI